MELGGHRLRPPSAVRLGMALLAALSVSGVTGVVLALAYDPSTEAAHDIVASQVGGVLGWVWSLHAWGATLLLLLAGFHLVRAWVTGRAQEVAWGKWVSGVAALAVLTLAFFSGTILSWDQQGWEALQHVQYGFDVVGVTLFDTDEPYQAPLSWVFYGHVFAVPTLLAGALGAHLVRGPDARAGARRVLVLARSGARWAWPVLPLLVILGFVWPPLHGPAPVPRLQLTRPDWPFLWLVPVQRALGSSGLWAYPAGLATLAVLPRVPWELSRRQRVAVFAALAGAWAALTVRGLYY